MGILKSNPRPPIAIVGIGCRLPGGVQHPADLVRLLREKRSGIIDVPADRWDAAAFHHPDFTKPGRIHVRRGGFIDGIDRFDPGFFGIAAQEAARMDPQQRLVLESVYRAIEDSGTRLDEIEGKRIAVVVGFSGYDYGLIQNSPLNRELIGPATNPGSTLSILANRASYVFDLRGPSFSVDTACSSALTSVHLACRAIWNEEADGAFVGGVNLLLRPETTIGFSKGNYLSPDGECRAFSDDANGYVRSEGCGVVYLKRLSDALADGDRIYALIRGGCVNQDGRTPGMTLPSADAQIQLLKSAYRDANVDPLEVTYIEAHGTGTPAGDPIEALALGEVIGRGRAPQNACRVGSIKSNIGHLESAAGIAGIIKLALTLWSRTIFPNRNFRNPNPAIPFEELRLRVPVAPEPLGDGRLIGGVNGFGFGGANAHIVLESAPVSTSNPGPPVEFARSKVYLFSAHSKSALKSMATDLADAVECNRVEPVNLTSALAAHRTRFDHRAAIVVPDRDRLIAELRGLGQTAEGSAYTMIGRASESASTGAGYIFSGQGPQWWGMGRGLLERDAIFQAMVAKIDKELTQLGWLHDEGGTLIGELTKSERASRMSETRIAQPAIFALQMGLVAILKDLGIPPNRVMGHSIGEVAAAVAAGCLTLEEGTRIVYHRSRSQALAEGSGLMAAIGLSEMKILELLADRKGKVELAAINGPSTVTVAGLSDHVRALVEHCESTGIFARQLNVSVPFHCFLMDSVEETFRAGLGKLTPQAECVPFVSSVTGNVVDGASLGTDYWWNNIRRPVRFQAAFETMLDAGGRLFVEIGPHPILKRDMAETAQARGQSAEIVPTLNRKEPDENSVARVIQELWTKGSPCLTRSGSREIAASLPPYPFQRETYWNESRQSRESRLQPNRGTHPHILAIRSKAGSPDQFTAELSWDQHAEPYLAEHVVQGVVVVPGAAQLDVVLSAAVQHCRMRSVTDSAPNPFGVVLENVEFRRAITPPDEADGNFFELDVQTDHGHFQIASRVRDEDAPVWMIHTRGRINFIDGRHADIVSPDFANLRSRIDQEIASSTLYHLLDQIGLSLGPSFRGIDRFWMSDREALSTIKLNPRDSADSHRFSFHPGILDSLIQTVGVCGIFREGDVAEPLAIPHRVERIEVFRSPGADEFWCHATITHRTETQIWCDIRAFTFDNAPLVAIDGLMLRRVPGALLASADYYQTLFEPCWEQLDHEHESAQPEKRLGEKTWLVIADARTRALARSILDRMEQSGIRSILGQMGEASAWNSTRDFTFVDCDLRALEGLLQSEPGLPRIDGVLDIRCCRHEYPPDAVAAELINVPIRACQIVQAIDHAERWSGMAPRMVFATMAAQSLERDHPSSINSIAATVLGFGRVLMAERSHWCVRLIDLSDHPTAEDFEALMQELEDGDRSREIAIRDGLRHVLTVRSRKRSDGLPPVGMEAENRSLGCEVVELGGLNPLAWVERPVRELSPNEVEIDVAACGVNFKDVALCLGLVERDVFDRGFTRGEIGMDCSGTIRRVGSDVRGLQSGDEVLGIAAGSFSNHVITKADLVVRKPSNWSFEQAAAVPIVFLTAMIALHRLARLAMRETILVHAGTGGVGLAAIHIARQLGANVIATAGSPSKIDYLKAMGIAHVFNSRQPDFREAVLDATGGLGVDVVLNSLSGRAMTQSFRCLAPYGRFVEIGKVDIAANRQIPLGQFSANQAYFGLDVDQWLKDRGPAVQEYLQECVSFFQSRAISPLPIKVFSAQEINQAIQYLASAQQIGKVVVTAPRTGAIRAIPRPLSRLDGSGWYIVTGGTRGYGLESAGWLVRHGVRLVALISRTGRVSEDDRNRLDELAHAGATVVVRSCDVSDLASVQRLCNELRQSAPVHGFVHAATVLDDAPINSLESERIATVVRSKAVAAWNLWSSLKNDDLRFCLFFSSISSIFGTPGQANYAAANAYLDSLARSLRASNVPAFVVNWGILDEVGIVGRASPEQRRKILAQGVVPFRRHDVHRLLDLIVRSDISSVIAARIDWSSERSFLIRERFPGIHDDGKSSGEKSDRSLLNEIQSSPSEARQEILAKAIFEHVAKLLGVSTLEIDLELRLDRLGIDSLTAVQLGAWTEKALGVGTPVVQIMRGPTSRELARQLLQKLDAAQRAEGSGKRQFPMIHCWRSVPQSRARLICLPDFLSDASLFESWSERVPEDVEIQCVNAFAISPAEPNFKLPISQLLEWIARELRPLLDRPYAIYGHSAGGWIGAELDRIAKEQGWRRPEFLACGAMPTATTMKTAVSYRVEEADLISDADVKFFFAKLNVPDFIAENSAMLKIARPRLWLCSRMEYDQISLPRDLPVLLFGGEDDPVPTLDKSPFLMEHRTAPIEFRNVPGDHLFVKTNVGRDAVIHDLVSRLGVLAGIDFSNCKGQ